MSLNFNVDRTHRLAHSIANGQPITQEFNLGYDVENRLVEVKKNDLTIALFTFDGNGHRVQQTVSGETILFVGTYYELNTTTNQVTKYYLAGATRIAMRKYIIPQTMSVEYMLGDHLGSTSMTTDTTGNKISEIRYTPWGDVRYHWVDPSLSTTPAYNLQKYSFTGQYSYMDDFGLMFYNARFYDPAIGRFSSADTIVPGGVQGLDRFGYVNNSPVNNTDPSGHKCIGGEDGNTSDDEDCLDDSGKPINGAGDNPCGDGFMLVDPIITPGSQFVGNISAGDLRSVGDKINKELYGADGSSGLYASGEKGRGALEWGAALVGGIIGWGACLWANIPDGELLALGCGLAVTAALKITIPSTISNPYHGLASAESLFQLNQQIPDFSTPNPTDILETYNPDDSETQTLYISDEGDGTVRIEVLGAVPVIVNIGQYNEYIAPYLRGLVCGPRHS